jgi:hypothetical protein
MNAVDYIANILGNVVIGTTVGTVSNILLPPVTQFTEDSDPEIMDITKQFLYIAVKSGINVYIMYQATQVFMNVTGETGSDPTNGALMLSAMLFSDHSLWDAFESTNKLMAQLVHRTMMI